MRLLIQLNNSKGISISDQLCFRISSQKLEAKGCYHVAIWNLAETWWLHQMETFSASLAICAGNSLATGEFPSHRPVTLSFDVFFRLPLNKWLSKQSWGWWFEMPLRSLWRHCNDSQQLWCKDACHISKWLKKKRHIHQSSDFQSYIIFIHYNNQAVLRPSYLYNGNSYTRNFLFLSHCLGSWLTALVSDKVLCV